MKAITRQFQRVDTKKKFGPILLEREDWPVVQMARNRKNFIEQVKQESLERILKLRPTVNALIEELEVTRYRERLRYKTNPWKVDPDDEMIFWEGVKNRLVEINQADRELQREQAEAILLQIIDRYANEIAGNFKPSHYRMARAVVTFGFARLLNATRIKRFGSFWSKEYTLQDKIQITGETELLRKLAKIGTIVMVPTHFSNLDSILIGWVIHTLGLPPFIYGAGLNLFNIEIFAYFMNSLGAYKVDRRKKNLVYLETLKTYSSLAIRNGCHSLFFPGGTRSRSGKIESQLKLGLLSTSVEAQRINYQEHAEGRRSKIFIVPVTLNYHFVLEAPTLIRDYLQRKGQERYYLESDRYSNSMRILKFLIKFFTKGSSISVSIGRGLDLFGNYVDGEGQSIDSYGNYINTREYFMFQGKITSDQQREEEYTRMMSNVIVREFHRINRVYGSHLVAYTAFQLLRKRYRKMDLYSMLRIPAEEIELDYSEFREVFNRLRNRIIELFNEGKLDMDEHLADDIDSVIEAGVENVGMYHSKRPLLRSKKGDIISQDLLSLYYYHNRLDGYELEAYV